MLLNPPYDNGVDPPIFETNLPRPMNDREYLLWMPQPRIEPTSEQISRSRSRPLTTPRDEYGIRSWHTNRHTHLLPRGL